MLKVVIILDGVLHLIMVILYVVLIVKTKGLLMLALLIFLMQMQIKHQLLETKQDGIVILILM